MVIDVIPKDQLLRLGEDARFNCKYQGIETVQWFFKETPLINSTRYEINKYIINTGYIVIVIFFIT